ncbi:methylated-DNA--[protein]-cysteine S-methyltransferase [Millisia brevis]|uniref:methylated-DNA--[protein]-cysteine S-methyltransferase n=1 Tax=Millisia brevis TaxID=264148 RepID=UPI00083428FE|nr:methylated-DNA--[protein]-cysteine S-methyltransferase [Millisia brevis]
MHTAIATAIGELTLTGDGGALTGLYFPAHRYPPDAERLGERIRVEDDDTLTRTAAQVREYLAGDRRDFDLPLRPGGNDFQESVWGMLLEIPYGATTTYGDLARRLGNVSLAQQVGQAVGHNPISLVIPCHRVVGHDGSLTGYAGGLDRKRTLLDLEEPEEARAGRLF